MKNLNYKLIKKLSTFNKPFNNISNKLPNIKETQLSQLNDLMILVDENDKKIGEISKLDGKKSNN